MKNLFVTAILILASTAMMAQESKPAPATQEAQPAKTTVTRKVAMKNHCCPDCAYSSQKPGTCPHHQKALIRDGMYYCQDGTTSREPGTCKDGKAMIRMVDKTKKPKEAEPAPAPVK